MINSRTKGHACQTYEWVLPFTFHVSLLLLDAVSETVYYHWIFHSLFPCSSHIIPKCYHVRVQDIVDTSLPWFWVLRSRVIGEGKEMVGGCDLLTPLSSVSSRGITFPSPTPRWVDRKIP